MVTPKREDHRRYLAYLERFQYFARGGLKKLTIDEYLALEERLDRGLPSPEEISELKRILLRD